MKKLSLLAKSAHASLLLSHIAFAEPLQTDPADDAPFTNDVELLRFSEHVMTYLGGIELNAAADLARRNSHTDDKITQRNLTETFESLRSHLTKNHPLEIKYIQRSAFGRSFIRHQYELHNDVQKLRCMLTYRRKTDGWRLNQLWCS